METAELIERLSREAAPVTRHAATVRLAGYLAAGALLSLLAMWAWLGIRPDLGTAMWTSAYWMKFAYTASLALIAFWIAQRLARPGAREIPYSALLIAPAAIIAILAMLQLMQADAPQRMRMMMGASSDVCPWRIVVLSAPVLAASLAALRKLAPTRLTLAGAVAGLLAGALGAWIYAFHCDESAAPFVAIWYSLGIAGMGAAGGALGSRLLRW